MIIQDNRTNAVEFGQVIVGSVCMYEGHAIMKVMEVDGCDTNAIYLDTGYPEFIFPDVRVEVVKAKLTIE